MIVPRESSFHITPDGALLLGPHSQLQNALTPTDWINRVLSRIWPKHLRPFLETTIINTLEPLIVASLPSALNSFKIDHCDLGIVAPSVENLAAKHNKTEIELSGKVRIRAATNIKVSLSMLSCGVSQIEFAADIVCRFLPLLDTIPFIGAVQFFFVRNPLMNLKYTGAAKIAGFPILEKTIYDIIQQQISLALVTPNAITVKMLNDVYDEEGNHVMNIFHNLQMNKCHGVCRISVIKANNLEDHDHVSIHRHDHSDPFVKLKVGQTEFQTDVVKDSLNPVWKNQHFDVLVTSTEAKVYYEVLDQDDAGHNDVQGKGSTKLKDLIAAKELVLTFEDGEKGSLTLQSQYYKLVDMPIEQIRSSPHGAVMTIGIECAKGLTRTPGCPELEPHVEVVFGLEKRSTLTLVKPTNEYLPVPDLENPRWDESFAFRIDEVPQTDISILLYSKKKTIAIVKLPVSRIAEANGDYQEWIDLDCEYKGAQILVHGKLNGLEPCDSPDHLKQSQALTETTNNNTKFVETATDNWLNTIIAAMWPHIAVYVKNTIKVVVEPMMQDCLPKAIKSLSFSEIDLGTVPPTIDGLSVTLQHRSMELLLDLSFLSNAKVEMALSESIKAGVNNPQFKARASLVIQPIYSQPPFFTGFQVLLLDIPGLYMDFTEIANVADWSFLKQTIQDLISKVIASFIVAPNRFLIPMPGVEEKMENHLVLPKGLLRIRCIDCVAIGNYDLKSLPDVYAMITVGAKVQRTSTINRGYTSRETELFWPEDEIHHFTCCSMDQTIVIECWDEDAGSYDERVGRTFTSMEKLCESAGPLTLEFLGESEGNIRLEGEMLALDKDEMIDGCSDDPPKIESRYGVITVLLDKLINIPEGVDPASTFIVSVKITDRDDTKKVVGEFTSMGITVNYPCWYATSYIQYYNMDPNNLMATATLQHNGVVILDWQENLLEPSDNVMKDRTGMKTITVKDGTLAGAQAVLGLRVCGTK